MLVRDNLGNRLSGANDASVKAYETACRELRCYIGDPLGSINTALAHSPEFTMGYVLKAYLHLAGTEPLAIPVARACYEAAVKLAGTAQENAHLEAVRLLADGQWRAAGRVLEDITIEAPRDALALQIGHAVDFFVGDSRMLRDRIGRALPMWGESLPGYHAILGMHAFGLEECGDYSRAEAQGRRGVELEPRDGWAQHAVAHVMEMQGRQREGIVWMRGNVEGWSRDSFFAVHNWWHLALYHLDLGEVDEVLKLFDGPIFGKRSSVVLEMVDVSAMLWRLHLRGINVGDRWQAIADNWSPIANAGNYAFNDAHAMMAFVGAGRMEAAKSLLEAQEERLKTAEGDIATFLTIGRPLTLALKAFGDGDYAQAVKLLRPIRNIANRFGGSHAQRDLIDLTLIEAAFRARQPGLAAALSAERKDVRPRSPLARFYREELLAKAS
jgi:hypothetical protein